MHGHGHCGVCSLHPFVEPNISTNEVGEENDPFYPLSAIPPPVAHRIKKRGNFGGNLNYII